MRFFFGNEPAMIPADYVWRIEPDGPGRYRIVVDPPRGKAIDLTEALQRVALNCTSSNDHLRQPLPKPE